MIHNVTVIVETAAIAVHHRILLHIKTLSVKKARLIYCTLAWLNLKAKNNCEKPVPDSLFARAVTVISEANKIFFERYDLLKPPAMFI